MAFIKAFRPSLLEKEVLRKFPRLIEKEIPEALKVIVFGSRARGDSDEGSDLDVAVIFDMPSVSGELWERVWDVKWRVLESFGAEEFPLSLTLITMKDLESRDFGLENTIKKEGIVIWERRN
jgi:predicted nucleotidyltransferase